MIVIVVAGTSCKSDGGTQPATTGSIGVTVATTGSDLDADGYTILVDGGGGQAVGTDGTVAFSNLSAGAHEVSLEGLAANCSVSGTNPRTVTVTAGQVATATFNVVCTLIMGDLTIITATTGTDLDADGFQYSIDGAAGVAIAVNDTVTIQLPPGTVSVELLGVAANCSVTGNNPRDVTVSATTPASTTFDVQCNAIATFGSLVATTATTGVDLDPDGYSVQVDGMDVGAIGLNATLSINSVAAGDRSVELVGLANNCSVTGNNPRTVTVTANTATQTDFAITCVDITGTVDVITSTTGVDIDPNGYTVRVEGVSPDNAIQVNDTVAVGGVVWGDRSVELLNLESNCVVSGSNPRTVTVPKEGTVQTTFDVSCVPLTGNLTVTASTTGSDLDPDGYTVTVDGGSAQSLPTNGSVGFSNVTVGDRSVELTGLAANCSVTGNNPATVTVPATGTVSHTFNVTCTSVTGSVQVTTSTTGSNIDPDGYTLTVEGQPSVPIGTGETLTVNNVSIGDRTVELTGLASNCSVSGNNPRTVTVTDGGTVNTTFNVTCLTALSNKIVFDSERDGGDSDIYVMNPNGTSVVRLTTNAARDAEPYISPNGTKILFVSDRDGDNEIFIMNADGTGQTPLTSDPGSDTEPAWSPDGTQIVFTSNRNGDDEVFVMNADGSGQTALTASTGRDGLAQWSNDGSKIVFTSARDGDLDIWVMNANGSSPSQLTNNTGSDFGPAWSPNGNQILFTSEKDGNREIYVMNTDGSGQTNLTNNAAADLAPQWSPDGNQIAWASSRDGNEEVYVANANGTGAQNITNNAAKDFEVSWGP